MVIGGIVGGAISMSYKYIVEPYLAARPEFSFSASSDTDPNAGFVLLNDGNAVAMNVSATIWATAAFAAQTDIIEIVHAGGQSDAECEVGLYSTKLSGITTSIPTPLNTEAKAVLLRCDRMRPGERWMGSVVYTGPEAVFGLTALVKDERTSQTFYGRFAESN